MSKVQIAMSMSLDGFVAGPDVSAEHPMGKGGERLHDWLFPGRTERTGNAEHTELSGVDAQVTAALLVNTGAVILGRRIFDTAIDLWGDTPYPVPCFVLTHRPQPRLFQRSGTFTFVTMGIEQALEQARIAAQDKYVTLMGAEVARQYLRAGLVDELEINLVPILLGQGVRLFEQMDAWALDLVQTRVLPSAQVTHLRYRVQKTNGKEAE